MVVSRGDIVVVVLSGDYGKPRPALVIQSTTYLDLASVTILPTTSDLQNTSHFRISVFPDETTGLVLPSQIMVDKAVTVPREKLARASGEPMTRQSIG